MAFPFVVSLSNHERTVGSSTPRQAQNSKRTDRSFVFGKYLLQATVFRKMLWLIFLIPGAPNNKAQMNPKNLFIVMPADAGIQF
jgi:hypothetical protein